MAHEGKDATGSFEEGADRQCSGEQYHSSDFIQPKGGELRRAIAQASGD